ncbi:Serine carboxypeptidase-like 49 [Abeliophyllum distichum]|uniref:Serine carboxypeptidase-like 49 n=1 Tax=Abeliophyllum distichum TaxID=126358 RepID=A0ABD1TEQ6_9LAMI
MTPPLSHCSLFLLFLSSFVPSYSVAATCDVNHLLHSTFEFPKTQAGKIIRELNLFLELDDDAVTAPKLVEKRIQFPNLRDDGDTVRNLGHRAGYHRLPHSKAARMFYFFLESRDRRRDPVVVWLSGGPGCSSSIALFYENGPFLLTENLSLVLNDFGWDKLFSDNMIPKPKNIFHSFHADRDTSNNGYFNREQSAV